MYQISRSDKSLRQHFLNKFYTLNESADKEYSFILYTIVANRNHPMA